MHLFGFIIKKKTAQNIYTLCYLNLVLVNSEFSARISTLAALLKTCYNVLDHRDIPLASTLAV